MENRYNFNNKEKDLISEVTFTLLMLVSLLITGGIINIINYKTHNNVMPYYPEFYSYSDVKKLFHWVFSSWGHFFGDWILIRGKEFSIGDIIIITSILLIVILFIYTFVHVFLNKKHTFKIIENNILKITALTFLIIIFASPTYFVLSTRIRTNRYKEKLSHIANVALIVKTTNKPINYSDIKVFYDNGKIKGVWFKNECNK